MKLSIYVKQLEAKPQSNISSSAKRNVHRHNIVKNTPKEILNSVNKNFTPNKLLVIYYHLSTQTVTLLIYSQDNVSSTSFNRRAAQGPYPINVLQPLIATPFLKYKS